MTEAERKAMEWLEAQLHGGTVEHVATLKAMLAQPRLPEVSDHKTIDAVTKSMRSLGWADVHDGTVAAVFDHLRRLHEPATREIEVERWGVMLPDGSWDSTYPFENHAKHCAERFPGAVIVRLTGKATVPA